MNHFFIKKFTTKKMTALLLSSCMMLSLTACEGKPAVNTNPISSTESAEATTDTSKDTSPSPNASKENVSPDKIEAGLGDLILYYNDKWTYDEEQSQDASLAFTRGNTLIGVVCSKETSYQVPMDMAQNALYMAKQQYDDLNVLEDIHEVTINGDTWAECTYETGSGDEKTISIQRCYGKNYYAYNVTYTGLEEDFEAYKSNAITILDSCVMSVPDNETGEAEGKKELAGELDAGTKGYLELKEDGTYYWYSDSSKAMDNVHYGKYICDNKIPSLNIEEGHNGYYLIMLPEKYFVNGEETDMGTYKIEFAMSKTTANGADYQGVNLGNYAIYDFTRVK